MPIAMDGREIVMSDVPQDPPPHLIDFILILQIEINLLFNIIYVPVWR